MSDDPYATPESSELRVPSALDREHAVAVRARLRGAERLVRSIGIVYFLQALAAIALVAYMFLPMAAGSDSLPALYLSSAVYLVVLGALLCVAGFGLVTLATWSRLCALLQTFFLLAGFMFGLYTLRIDTQAGFVFAILHSLPFYVLFGPKAGYVLSPGYAAIVAAAPGRVAGALPLALLIATMFLALIAADALLLSRL